MRGQRVVIAEPEGLRPRCRGCYSRPDIFSIPATEPAAEVQTEQMTPVLRVGEGDPWAELTPFEIQRGGVGHVWDDASLQASEEAETLDLRRAKPAHWLDRLRRIASHIFGTPTGKNEVRVCLCHSPAYDRGVCVLCGGVRPS